MKRSFPLAQFSVPGDGGRLTSATGLRFACGLFGRRGGPFTVRQAPVLASRHFAGFTLIELMVVVTIVAVIAAISIGTLGYVQKKSAMSRAEVEVATLSAAIDRFFNDYGVYPPSATELYSELTGESAEINTNQVVYFEPTPGMVSTNGGEKIFADPFGNAYRYVSDRPRLNVGFFDLWSVPPEGNPDDPKTWIHN